ncbi:SH3 domain-containing protein [Limibacterium fermenti]|uniref:SH3 domain-containing protein n=1 Tax=Limibacterium fermenti TaxID=3229863 RepID=UPI000E80B910|nr:SH3 domain-containing protein [Porphyromonadaceae bacterium]
MSLKEKYKELIDAANQYGVSVNETANGLKFEGTVSSAEAKNKLWEIYGKLDPNFKSADVILNVKVNAPVGSKVKVVTQQSNLNIRKGPGTDQPIVGKAAHGDVITLVSKYNDQWWFVLDKDGEEGYSYAQYLEPVNE